MTAQQVLNNDALNNDNNNQQYEVAMTGAEILLALLLGILATAIWEGGKALWDLITNDPDSLIESLPAPAQDEMQRLSNELSRLKHAERQATTPELQAGYRQQAAIVLDRMANIYTSNRGHIAMTNPKIVGVADILAKEMRNQAGKLRRNEIEIPVPNTGNNLALQPNNPQKIYAEVRTDVLAVLPPGSSEAVINSAIETTLRAEGVSDKGIKDILAAGLQQENQQNQQLAARGFERG
jgi:hypothetical protein